MKPVVYRGTITQSEQKKAFQDGHLYSLEHIKGITNEMKFILSRSSPYGLFFLYKQKSNNHLWISGPFKGKETNYFFYLGKQPLPKGTGTSFASVIRKNLENDWKKFRENQKDEARDVVITDVESFQRWARSILSFDDAAFSGYFD
ncbi:MAG: hypothetical protein RJB66_2725 [Pseudomonadota bacterium]|jgi:hypothetical protein